MLPGKRYLPHRDVAPRRPPSRRPVIPRWTYPSVLDGKGRVWRLPAGAGVNPSKTGGGERGTVLREFNSPCPYPCANRGAKRGKTQRRRERARAANPKNNGG